MTTQRRTKEDMLTEMVQLFGFEDKRTIGFAAKCKSYSDTNFDLDRLEGEVERHKALMWWEEV